MPKLTAKYVAATHAAKEEGLQAIALPGVEALYAELAKRNYFWTPSEGRWIVAPLEDAEPPSKVLRIRVWADKEIVEDLADDIRDALKVDVNWDLIEKSPVYPCRPPKQLDGRVYLTFALPKKKQRQA